MNKSTTETNLGLLREAGIQFEYKAVGGKRLAVIELDNKMKVMFCAKTCKCTYRHKKYDTKSVKGLVKFVKKLNEDFINVNANK